jgi:hypothetical protein
MHALPGGCNEKQVHSASRKGTNVKSRTRMQDMKAGAELVIALGNSFLTDKKETRTCATFDNDWMYVESSLFAAIPAIRYDEESPPKNDIEKLGSKQVQLHFEM